MLRSLVGSEMCIRDRVSTQSTWGYKLASKMLSCFRPNANKPASGPPRVGYRVLKVSPASPAEKVGLQPFLDFIVDLGTPHIDASEIVAKKLDFFAVLSRSEDKEIMLKVYNIRSRLIRELKVTPNKGWPSADSLLGTMIRLENLEVAYEATMRVLNVQPGSPAAQAGLVADEDYLLGIMQSIYSNLNELIGFIEYLQKNAANKSIELCLFNIRTKAFRFAIVHPAKGWGGKGLLGCEFGTGLLHRLPLLREALTEENGGLLAETSKASLEETHVTANEGSGENEMLKRVSESTVRMLEERKQKATHPPSTSHEHITSPFPQGGESQSQPQGQAPPPSEVVEDAAKKTTGDPPPETASAPRVTEFSFYSAKLGGKYTIKRSELFDLSVDVFNYN
eukprot:TRINITY_DN2873_c0_g1_i4.p1 TRINITY_DN2873_c0_g1~~TRINITY_DN2873_c0_g1_i4.p1  ORF type:complete len:394 (-),score=105.09 TRINITY_DN2873_c0_g1_i4:32-1213(-)